MPTNIKKVRRMQKKKEETPRELVLKEPEQEYGQVITLLGDSRLEVHCFDGITRICHIRGAMKKRTWIAKGNIVLVSLRDFAEKQADVIYRYTADQVIQLKKLGVPIPKEAELVNEEEVEFKEEVDLDQI